ncbi:MAG TPA: hypothetical protein VMO75_05805 [Chthoniobacterales bacterium]|nr:hypothetical protein [Chthoniobacterales bacterium]
MTTTEALTFKVQDIRFNYDLVSVFAQILRKYRGDLHFPKATLQAIEGRIRRVVSAKVTKILQGRLVKERIRSTDEEAITRIANSLWAELQFRPLFGYLVHFAESETFKAATKTKDSDYFIRLGRALERPNPMLDHIDLTILFFWEPGVTFQNIAIRALMLMRDTEAARSMTGILLRSENPISEEMYKKRRQRLQKLGLISGQQISKGDNAPNSRPRQISKRVSNGAHAPVRARKIEDPDSRIVARHRGSRRLSAAARSSQFAPGLRRARNKRAHA